VIELWRPGRPLQRSEREGLDFLHPS